MDNARRQFVLDAPDQRFANAAYAVSASPFEFETLRYQFQSRLPWESHSEPLRAEVCEVEGHPVHCNFFFWRLNNHLVIFYNVTGDVDPRAKVKDWLRSQGVSNITEAILFHNVVMAVTGGQGLDR